MREEVNSRWKGVKGGGGGKRLTRGEVIEAKPDLQRLADIVVHGLPAPLLKGGPQGLRSDPHLCTVVQIPASIMSSNASPQGTLSLPGLLDVSYATERSGS